MMETIEFAIPYLHWYIYGLIDPRTNEVFYVGAALYPKSRLGQHIWTVRSSRGNYASKQYIKILLSLGIRPYMLILDEIRTSRGEHCDTLKSYELENYWINLAQSTGMAWCNNTSILSDDRESTPLSKIELSEFASQRPVIDRNPHNYTTPEWWTLDYRIGDEVHQNPRPSIKPGPKSQKDNT